MPHKDNEWVLAQAKANTLRRFVTPGSEAENWFYVRVGKAIKAFRADQEISQAELARRISDYPAPMLCVIEKGHNQFAFHDYVLISKALGITLDDLIKRAETFRISKRR